MKSRTMTWAISALLLSIPFLANYGCGSKDKPEGREAASVSVQAITLAPVTENALVDAVGSLQAARETSISGKVMGTVTEIRKHAGDLVRQGETLLTIDSRDVSGQIAQAEGAQAQAKAAAVLAETNFHRFEQLQARGSASQMELDQARYQYDSARGAVEQADGAVATAKSYQSYATIPAPFSGRVVDQLCEVGDLASPGRPLMKMEDPSRLRLFASLDAAKAKAAIAGSTIVVRVPSIGDRLFHGKISEVVPAADPATHSILLKVDLEPDPSLQSGLFASALLPSGQRQVLRVPRSAVVQRGGIVGVFVVDSGHAAFRMVMLAGEDAAAGPGGNTGDHSGDASSDRLTEPEVLSGLSAGDRVIVEPPAGLEIGSSVEVRS